MTSLRILLKINNVLDTICRGNQKHVLYSITFIPESHDFYQIMWKSMAEPDRIQMA